MKLFRKSDHAPVDDFSDAPAPLRLGRPRDKMIWLGGFLALLGWVLIIAAMTLSEVILKSGSLVATLSLRSDAVTLGQTAVLTGLGLMVFGALRQGFGALRDFFETVLQRSTAPRPDPVPVEPEPPMQHPTTDRMPAKGRKGSNYVILPDGSVEVETLLGTRIFATLEEARDFIH